MKDYIVTFLLSIAVILLGISLLVQKWEINSQRVIIESLVSFNEKQIQLDQAFIEKINDIK